MMPVGFPIDVEPGEEPPIADLIHQICSSMLDEVREIKSKRSESAEALLAEVRELKAGRAIALAEVLTELRELKSLLQRMLKPPRRN